MRFLTRDFELHRLHDRGEIVEVMEVLRGLGANRDAARRTRADATGEPRLDRLKLAFAWRPVLGISAGERLGGGQRLELDRVPRLPQSRFTHALPSRD